MAKRMLTGAFPPNRPGKTKAEKVEWETPTQPAIYADIVRARSSERHTLLDFAQSHPDISQIIVHTQIALHPRTMVELVMILAEQIKAYEKSFGPLLPEGVSLTITDGKGTR